MTHVFDCLVYINCLEPDSAEIVVDVDDSGEEEDATDAVVTEDDNSEEAKSDVNDDTDDNDDDDNDSKEGIEPIPFFALFFFDKFISDSN